VISGSALAKYMILAVALSALGSTLASLVSGVRVTFAMGADGVLPRAFGRTDAKFKTPVLATVIIGVIASIGVWLYTFGSASVQDSFTTVVSVDGLLFALYYALTGIATAVYYRKLAVTSPWSIITLAVFPLAAAGFLAYIIVRSVEGLGGWTGRDLVSLYVMIGIGVAIMIYVRFWGKSDYFNLPRETYQPSTESAVASTGNPKTP
jgi:amino acid transporter